MQNGKNRLVGYGNPRTQTTVPQFEFRDKPPEVDPMFTTFPEVEPLPYADEHIGETPPDAYGTPSDTLKGAGNVALSAIMQPQQNVLQLADRENKYTQKQRSVPEIMEQYGVYDYMGVGDASMTGEPWKDTPINARRAVGYGGATLLGELMTDPLGWWPGGYAAKKGGQTVARTVDDIGGALSDTHLGRALVDETGAIGKLPKKQGDLVVTHNLNAENVKYTDEEMGGNLIAPSVAVTKPDQPMQAFGDISLVGDSKLADPKNKSVSLFDADIYSPRHTRALYDVNDDVVDELQRQYNPTANRVGDRLFSVPANVDGPDSAMLNVNSSPTLKTAFIEETLNRPLNVPTTNQNYITFADQPAVKTYYEDAINRGAHPRDSSDEYRRFSEAMNTAAEEYAQKWGDSADAVEWLRRDMKRQYFDENGFVKMGSSGDELIHDEYFKMRSGEGSVDKDALSTVIRDGINEAGGLDKYHSWAKELLKPVYGKKFFNDINGKRRPYTPESVLKDMLSKPVRGGEDFASLGSARSKGARQFESLDDVRSHKDKLIPEEQMSTLVDDSQLEFSMLAEKMQSDYSSGVNLWEELYEVIGDSYTGKRIEQGLLDRGISADQQTIGELKEFSRRLAEGPTAYFEGKIRRMVQLGEFKGAVVPINTDQQTIDILKRRGITHIEKYNPADKEGRASALGKFKDLAFVGGGVALFGAGGTHD